MFISIFSHIIFLSLCAWKLNLSKLWQNTLCPSNTELTEYYGSNWLKGELLIWNRVWTADYLRDPNYLDFKIFLRFNLISTCSKKWFKIISIILKNSLFPQNMSYDIVILMIDVTVDGICKTLYFGFLYSFKMHL